MKRFFNLSVLFLLAAFVLFSGASFAAEPNVLLRQFEEEGGKVEYLGKALGLDGWIIFNKEGSAQYVYTNKEGATVIGMLFAPDASMVTKNQVREYMARTKGVQKAVTGAEYSDAVPSEKIYADVENGTSWVQIGKKDAPYIYMFINTACEHCLNALKDLLPHVNAGKLSIRVVPFGSQQENYMGAAVLLSTAEPQKLLEELIAGYKNAPTTDKRLAEVKEGIYPKVEVNNMMAKKIVPVAPPFSIYRNLKDGKINVISGAPSNIMMLLADLVTIQQATDAVNKSAKPDDIKPAEAKPVEPKPEETKPAETKPEEAKPAEAKTGGLNPEEIKTEAPNTATPKGDKGK